MIELIETLNATSACRTTFYCLVFLAACGITANALVRVAKFTFKKKS